MDKKHYSLTIAEHDTPPSHSENNTDINYRKKLEKLQEAKLLTDEQSPTQPKKDPLFMNIDQIAQLPMASKKPVQIVTTDTLMSTMASSSAGVSDPQGSIEV